MKQRKTYDSVILSPGRLFHGEPVQNLATLFKAQGVHREALAALALFRQAAEAHVLTVRLVREILDFLQKARLDPSIRFESRATAAEGREEVDPQPASRRRRST